MIRLIHCVKRRNEVSLEQFRKFWQSEEFDHFIRALLADTPGITINKNLTLEIEFNKILREERHAREAYDGVIEVIFPSGVELLQVTEDSEQFDEVYQQMVDYQTPFIDFEESVRFITEYN
jgi:hypothetical protein